MTVQNPPIYLQAGSHPAEDVRRFHGALVNDTSGILASADLAVTQNGTPNMSVNVAGGRAFIAGTEATYQGTYFVENRGVQNVSVGASDPTNARYDLVVARVRDSSYSGVTNAWAIEIVAGTPSGSPAEPAIPASSLVLARILIPAGSTTVTNANILDRRIRSQHNTGVILCTSSTRPAIAWEGMMAYETDTNRAIMYNGTHWIQTNPVAARTDVSQSTASSSYVDLATVGPSVSCLTGTSALVTLTAFLSNSAGGAYSAMSFAVSGATTLAANDTYANFLQVNASSQQYQQGVTQLVTGLTAGVNTFTAKYKGVSGTATFDRRCISVVGLF